jgi:hypothetical protein
VYLAHCPGLSTSGAFSAGHFAHPKLFIANQALGDRACCVRQTLKLAVATAEIAAGNFSLFSAFEAR